MKALLAMPAPHRETVALALAEGGWEVVTAGDGAEAMAIFTRAPQQLVVLDAAMEGPGGRALCDLIRASTLGRAAYLIALLDPRGTEAVRQMAHANVDDFIALPISPAALALRLSLAEHRLGVRGDPGQADPRMLSYPERIAQLHHALQVERALLEELFGSAPEGIVVVDGDDRVIRINGEFTRMFGFSADAAVGRPINELIVPARLAEEAGHITGGVIRGERIMVDTVRQHRDGREIEVSLLATPIRVAGGQIGAYGIYRDITDRKAHLRELAESEARYRGRSVELERAMQARNRLYTAMSHELRTPISAIMLYQELLLSGAVGDMQAEQRDALENSYAAAQHLLELVNDVLDLSKIEAGKITVEPGPVAVGEFLDDLLVTVLPLAHRHGSEIQLELDDVQAVITTDAQRLRQILLNLVSNAAKFGRGRPIGIHCQCRGPRTVIEVRDGGIGIAATDLAHIFEDFVQVGSAQSGGTGLGLAISRRLAELLGGRLEVESEIGVGSTFRLVLESTPPELSTGSLER